MISSPIMRMVDQVIPHSVSGLTQAGEYRRQYFPPIQRLHILYRDDSIGILREPGRPYRHIWIEFQSLKPMDWMAVLPPFDRPYHKPVHRRGVIMAAKKPSPGLAPPAPARGHFHPAGSFPGLKYPKAVQLLMRIQTRFRLPREGCHADKTDISILNLLKKKYLHRALPLPIP